MSSSPFSLAVGGLLSLLAAFSLSTGCRAEAAAPATPPATQSAPIPAIPSERARRAHARGGGAVSDPASCVIRD